MEQIKLFLENAEDEKYLLWKVVLIMGVSGAMRRDELTKITVDNIQDTSNILIITVPDTKTDINRTFTITNPDYIRLYHKYIALRPKYVTCHRLFLRYKQGRCYAQVIGVVTLLLPLVLSSEQWSIPTHSQYHIQTDEGPERYFQYQTQSGQYRKEKRLEDGTIIGSYAWIDANGMLWLREYVADNDGYRIVRSKNLYVGKDTPIERAVKAAKYASPSSGTLVKQNTPSASPSPSYSYSAPAKPQTTYLPSSNYLPQVQVHTHSGIGYGSTHLPADVSTLVTSTESPATATIPVVNIPSNPSVTPSPTYLPSTTPTDVSHKRPSTYLPPTNSYVSSTPSNLYLPVPPSSTISPPLASNAVDYPEYSGAPQYEHYNKPFANPYVFQNGPTYPIDKNGHTFNGYGNKIGNGYEPQYPEYDGVSVTNDGFRYFIPRAYHEEQALPGNTKSGSFGYIDPFGIRRVIYYNASPESGFQHRKNNRYVGFNATPYDPRPYS
ncbi:cuticle protein [Holotrichia oblita]|uniref:Cuticle protein n=1 Tax=Holotrichia oblita TaxID=644536 RepID=A0ACB9TEG7_HOLOL|nr:cuticle protein [Holotrichia oblita]